jgi:hypothetical protein
MQFWSTLVTLGLLVIMFVATLVAGSRPLGLASRVSQPDDIMLCVGAPVTDPATAGFLSYFARQTSKFQSERIGLTSSNLRLVPLTRDYRYAGDVFLRYARLAALQRQNPLPPAQALELRDRVAEFSRPLEYVDYAASVDDVLALCMAGFPAGDDESQHRRTVVYLNDNSIRENGERRPALFNSELVTQMARSRGIQISVLDRFGTGDPAASEGLRAIAAASGGTFGTYDPAGSEADLAGGTDPALSAGLDRIRVQTPEVVAADAKTPAWTDRPNVFLIAGVALATLLCISLVVLRP